MVKKEYKKVVEKVSNLNYLAQTMGGNKKLIKEIMDVFLKQAPEELSVINTAVDQEDYTTIRNTAHTMKSSASIMGITSLATILKEIEDLAKGHAPITGIRPLNEQLNAICTQAIREIEKERVNYA